MNTGGGPLVFTAGMSASQRGQVFRQVQTGALRRVLPGAYVRTDDLPTTTEERYLLILHAAAGTRPGAIMVGKSAAYLHKLPRPSAHFNRAHPQNIEMGRAYSRRLFSDGASLLDITCRKVTKDVFDRAELVTTEIGDIRVASIEDTCMQLAQWHSLEEAVVAAESTVSKSRGSVSIGRFGPHLITGKKGAKTARQALNLITQWSESPMESELKVRMWEAGLPAPYQQVWINRDNRQSLGRVDFLFPCGLVVEYDGQEKYIDGSFGRADYSATKALFKENSRHKKIAALGYEIIRIDSTSYRDGFGVEAIADRLEWMKAHPGRVHRSTWIAMGKAWREKSDHDWVG